MDAILSDFLKWFTGIIRNAKRLLNLKMTFMNKKLIWVLWMVALLMVVSSKTKAQDIYTITGGELLFQSGAIEKGGADMNTNMRFTLWFHLGEYVHLDVSKNIGFFTGLGVRNVGFITEENDIKTKYRSYMLGAPLALKLGSFDKNFFIYGGGEYEWMFHFKQKTFVNDEKIKYSDWFSNRTPDFIPSVFVGIQFPYGANVKFKYYLKDFLAKVWSAGNPAATSLALSFSAVCWRVT